MQAKVTELFRDKIRLIIKDTGKIDDLTNEDRQIADFRSYFLSSLMHAQKQKIYLITGGYNRSVYYFPIIKSQESRREDG